VVDNPFPFQIMSQLSRNFWSAELKAANDNLKKPKLSEQPIYGTRKLANGTLVYGRGYVE